jgi:site-specific DNA-methyltransferase (adenine-specific)
MKIEIYNDDCLDRLPKIPISKRGQKINLVVVDLPYGQTDCKWDVKINLKEMWKCLYKICKKNCIYVFFTTTKFGIELINSNPKGFRYDLVWEKINSVGFLSSRKYPLRKHEMIYIFSIVGENDTKREHNKELRNYSKGLLEWINKPRKQIFKECGNLGLSHFMYYNGYQFGIPIKNNYQFLIDKYKIDKYEKYITYDELKTKYEGASVYNPQKTKGKTYVSNNNNNNNIQKNTVYGNIKKISTAIHKDRYPTSILKFGHDKDKYHQTQKPVGLCEWLINTYSNEGDLVLDFTMGSGSTGIACINTNRNFIGIEKDNVIFKTARNRLIQHEIRKKKLSKDKI